MMAGRPALEEAFLAAIAEAPEDDVPRLVYADWLEDHGDPDRAEFIRVQCELARLDFDDPRCGALSTREEELLEAHRAKWSECLGSLIGKAGVVFRRGMPEEIPLREGAGNDDLRHLRSISTLRGLGLGSAAITDDGLRHLHGLNNLLVVGLVGSGVTDAGLPHLLALPRLVLILDDDEQLSEEAHATFRHSLEQRFLQFPPADRRAAAIEFVQYHAHDWLGGRGAVRAVVIHDHQLFDEEMIFFTALPELELLEIHEASGITSAALRHLVELRGLRSLSLSATSVTSIDALAGLPLLETLCLSSVPSLGFDEAAALEKLKRLRELELWWCDVSDATLRRLSGLGRLEKLDVNHWDGEITDDGLRVLGGLSGLKVVNLQGHTRITDAGLEHLHGLNQLERLELDGTSVSIEGARALIGVLPKVEVAVAGTLVKRE